MATEAELEDEVERARRDVRDANVELTACRDRMGELYRTKDEALSRWEKASAALIKLRQQ